MSFFGPAFILFLHPTPSTLLFSRLPHTILLRRDTSFFDDFISSSHQTRASLMQVTPLMKLSLAFLLFIFTFACHSCTFQTWCPTSILCHILKGPSFLSLQTCSLFMFLCWLMILLCSQLTKLSLQLSFSTSCFSHLTTSFCSICVCLPHFFYPPMLHKPHHLTLSPHQVSFALVQLSPNLSPRIHLTGLPGGSVVKNTPANARDADFIPGSEAPWEKEMATHSGIFAWEIPWTEEPAALQSMRSQRVGQDLVTIQQSVLHASATLPLLLLEESF